MDQDRSSATASESHLSDHSSNGKGIRLPRCCSSKNRYDRYRHVVWYKLFYWLQFCGEMFLCLLECVLLYFIGWKIYWQFSSSMWRSRWFVRNQIWISWNICIPNCIQCHPNILVSHIVYYNHEMHPIWWRQLTFIQIMPI